MNRPADTPGVLAGRYSPRVARAFRLIARRMIRGRFHALRFSPGSLARLDAVARHDGPVVVCMTHAGWWDPMLGLLLHIERFERAAGRSGIAPIDRDVLESLGIFRRLGLFGIDPDDPASMRTLVQHAAGHLTRPGRPTLWITPQGRFQDPREQPVPRPGVSAILSSVCRAGAQPRAVVLAAEYPFWDDKKPEMLAHADEISLPDRAGSTAAWHRCVSAGMRRAVDDLTGLAVLRDPGRFETVLGDRGGGTFFLYDWWLGIRGKSAGAIRTRGERPRQAHP